MPMLATIWKAEIYWPFTSSWRVPEYSMASPTMNGACWVGSPRGIAVAFAFRATPTGGGGGVLATDPSVKLPSGHRWGFNAGSRGRFTWGQSASVSVYPAGNGSPAKMVAGGVARGMHMG